MANKLTVFDPKLAARYEVSAWRKYYEKEYVGLVWVIFMSFKDIFQLSIISSLRAGLYSGSAARLYKKDEENVDYRLIRLKLYKFYKLISDNNELGLDVDSVVDCELKWWDEHREKGYKKPTGKLVGLLAEWAQLVYGVDAKRSHEYAQHRANAMCMRHSESNAGDVTEPEWKQIEALLASAYSSISSASK